MKIMKSKAEYKISEIHLSRTKRQLDFEIPADIVNKTIKEHFQKPPKKRGIKGLHIERGTVKKGFPFEPLVDLARQCFEDALKDYPSKMIGIPSLKIRPFSPDAPLKMTAEFEVAVKKIKNLDGLRVSKEKFCQANVDKNIEHKIQKHRESLAVRMPISEKRSMQVGDSTLIECQISHKVENVLETITDLSFDLIEEDSPNKENSSHKIKKLKATADTLDKITLSTLILQPMLSCIEENKTFFNMKVGDKKQVYINKDSNKISSDDEDGASIVIQVHLKEIYKKKLPPIDYKFAHSMGFSSIHEMNKKLKEKYTHKEQERINKLLHNDIIREFIKQNPPGFFSKYILGAARKLFSKEIKADMMNSGIASKELVDQKIQNWTKDKYIENESKDMLKEMITVINLARKWNVLETIAQEYRHKVITTPGLLEKLKSELPPGDKSGIHPLVYEMIKKTVAKGLLSTAIITEIEPTDRDESRNKFLPEAVKATQVTTLEQHHSSPMA